VDTIHIQLNKIENTPSECEKIWQLLEEQHRLRKAALQKCLSYVEKELHTQNQLYTKQDAKKKIKTPKLEGEKSWIENELNVEDILHDHSLKIFRRKCSSYKPPTLS
jgi:5'(3')-deoxyribonucleotidase